MQSGLHAVGVGVQRVSIVVGVVAIAAFLAYALLVFFIIAIQAFSALGQ